MSLNISDLRKKIDNNELDSEDLFKESLNKAYEFQDEYNSFVTIIDEYKKEDSNSWFQVFHMH